ncbi:MAG: bifunctional aspartate kinase/homoserine dehydrogenase I [Rhodothermales bacterium]
MSLADSARPIRVAKFGGSSVGTPDRVREVVRLVAAMPEAVRPVVVSSAFGGVTDVLLAAIEAAKGRTGEHADRLAALRTRHAEAVDALALDGERDALNATLKPIFDNVAELLHGVYLLRECTPRFQDAIISAGERLSVPVVAAAFRAAGHAAVALDATAFVRTDDAFGEAAVDFAETERLTRARFAEIDAGTIPVVTGFVASTDEGVTTTLGRSGSDYTATILGGALDADEVVIWTDVDGVLSADPRIAPEAFTLAHLSYREAAELAHFGAKVLHPRTMRPLEEKGIPLRIKNTMNPDAPGSLIVAEPPPGEGHIRAITAVRAAALVTLEGAGIIGVPDLTARVFETLADADLPVLLIAQASSQGSLCFAVRDRDRAHALRVLEKEFERECERGDLHGIRALPDVAVLAGVGKGMREVPGLAGRMFATLARARVNVLAIAEGASEHNLSAVVADGDAPRAVDALHEAFPLRRLRAHVVVVGAGTIGRKLLDLLARQAPDLLERQRLNLRLVGLADSRRLTWDERGLAFDGARERLDAADSSGLDAVTERIAAARLERLVVVDATASEEVARRYPDWLRAGAAVVTPNKQANTLGLDFYDSVRAAAREGEAPFLYETTVGAGLSVISTLRDLIRTGDRVRRIEGVLSGTLAFLFNALRDGTPFSAAVRLAAERGYTEPDPRADLSGEDVGRKLLTLAREMGLRPEPDAVRVESLVPEALRAVPLTDFWDRLAEHDAAWERRVREHAERGEQMQYVSLLTPDEIHAGVRTLPPDSPLADLRGAANVVAFHTERYAEEPLIVQGPGASAEITASVLLADIVRAAEAMR